MDELIIQELIKVKFSGGVNDISLYVNLVIQTIAVLVGGIILWRVSVVIHKKKLKERKRNTFFDTPYSKSWRKK